MPYHPPHETHNRVDEIKKKFEEGARQEKPAVKRTPAFRCDRIVCGKNVTNISPKSRPAWGSVQSDSEGKISPPRFKKSFSDGSVRAEKTELKTFDNGEEISEKIRNALQSPLPAGPPPKKPPRLFTHTPQKDEARLKLEKLENFILKHEKSGNVVVARKCDDDAPRKRSEQCGLASLSCLSECVDEDVYVLEKQTKSVLNRDIRNSRKASINSLGGKENVSQNFKEPIYAQPFKYDLNPASVSGNFPTFGKLSQLSHPYKTESQLHYMCTDLSLPKDSTENSNCLPLTSAITAHPASSSAVSCLSNSVLATSLDPIRIAPNFSEKKLSIRVPTARKTSWNSSSPPDVSPSNSPIGNARKLMDKFFGDNLSWDSDEASGLDSPEDTPSLDIVKTNGFHISPASSPSLHSISSQTDDEILPQLTAKRKVYLKRVSSHLVASDRQAFVRSSCSDENSGNLFESCLLIGLTLIDGPNGKKNRPYVKSFFPTNVTPPPLIEFLCFPDADDWPKNTNRKGEQVYSIVLTNEKGERKFGYCRRVVPEGSDLCLPLAYCIISRHRATGFYFTVLEELESRHGTPELDTLIEQLYHNEFPNPGQSLKLNRILERAKQNSTRVPPFLDSLPSTLVRRPEDDRLENRDVTLLFRHLNIPVFLKIFSSILLERKVLLLGSSLSTLSCCIEGLQSVLYPFSWQHTYVPVLPMHMLALCEAPTPYILGVLKTASVESTLSSHFSEVLTAGQPLETSCVVNRRNFQGIMVDLEENRVISSCKDEATILPSKLRKSLRAALTLATTAESAVTLPDAQKNVLASEAFLRFFVEVCGHYEHHIVPQSDGSRIFQRESFIRALPSSSGQSFLEWFTETALFNTFIQDRVEYEVHDLFWKRSLQATHFADSKGRGRKTKTLGDRIKDLANFNFSDGKMSKIRVEVYEGHKYYIDPDEDEIFFSRFMTEEQLQAVAERRKRRTLVPTKIVITPADDEDKENIAEGGKTFDEALQVCNENYSTPLKHTSDNVGELLGKTNDNECENSEKNLLMNTRNEEAELPAGLPEMKSFMEEAGEEEEFNCPKRVSEMWSMDTQAILESLCTDVDESFSFDNCDDDVPHFHLSSTPRKPDELDRSSGFIKTPAKIENDTDYMSALIDAVASVEASVKKSGTNPHIVVTQATPREDKSPAEKPMSLAQRPLRPIKFVFKDELKKAGNGQDKSTTSSSDSGSFKSCLSTPFFKPTSANVPVSAKTTSRIRPPGFASAEKPKNLAAAKSLQFKQIKTPLPQTVQKKSAGVKPQSLSASKSVLGVKERAMDSRLPILGPLRQKYKPQSPRIKVPARKEWQVSAVVDSSAKIQSTSNKK